MGKVVAEQPKSVDGYAAGPNVTATSAAAAPTAPATPPPPRAGRKEWVGLAVIALPCLLYSMDLIVLHLAVPQISEQLKPSGAELLWIIDIYGFLVAGSLITMGALGDRIGRRRLLLIGAAAFGAASVLAAEAISAARDTLGGAVAIAGQLPDQLGAVLIDTARQAFMRGLQLAAAISAAGSLCLAVYTAVALRRVPAYPQAADTE